MSKKILIVTNHFYPEQFRINDICSELVARGHSVHVITQIPNYPSGVFYDGYSKTENRFSEWEGVTIQRLWCIPRGHNALTLLLNYLSYWLSTFWFSLFHKDSYDTVLAYMTSPIFMVGAAQRIARRSKAKMILYTLDMWPDNFYAITGLKSNLLTKPLEIYCKNRYLKNDLLIVSSQKFIESIRKLTGKDTIDFLYLPQHGESIYQTIERPQIYQYLDQSKFNITFTGNVGKAQGLDFLVDVAKILESTNDTSVRFNIVGDGSYLETLKGLVTDANLSKWFVFHGRKPIGEMSSILAETDLGLISFANEPIYFMTIPAKLQSYLATSTPVITYADGELNRVVNEDNLGYAIKIGDIDGFMNALKSFQNLDVHEKEQLKENALNYFKANFDKTIIIDKLENNL